MVTVTNYVIDRAGFTFHGALGTSEIFEKASCQVQMKTKKKVLPSVGGVPGTVPYGESARGYCITLMKRLNEGLK